MMPKKDCDQVKVNLKQIQCTTALKERRNEYMTDLIYYI